MRVVHLGGKLIAIAIGINMLFGCQNPDQHARKLEKYGVELFENGEYNKAELEFNNALKEDGTLATTYY